MSLNLATIPSDCGKPGVVFDKKSYRGRKPEMTLSAQSVPGDLGASNLSGSEAALQSAVAKAALRFVPLLTIAYLFNYLDRTSLGFAALTMNKQLGLSPGQFGLAAGILLVGYCLFEVPTGHWGDRYGSRGVIARIAIWWSIFTALTEQLV